MISIVRGVAQKGFGRTAEMQVETTAEKVACSPERGVAEAAGTVTETTAEKTVATLVETAAATIAATLAALTAET